jgi:eukaryotic-like serine/threonine-protein kinase
MASVPRMRGDDPLGAIIAQRYVLRKLLGIGGIACAYRADDAQEGRAMTIKICRRDRVSVARALLREATLLQRVTHPNASRFAAYGELGDGRTYLTTEWIEGRPLATLMCRSPLSVDQSLDVAEAVLEALAAIHAAGVLHRDVKPQNVLIPSTAGEWMWRRAVVIDFDAAAEMNDPAPNGAMRVRGGLISGTPEYVAPEQIMGEPHGPAADIFGVGGLLFRLLTGVMPTTQPSTSFILEGVDREIVVPVDRLFGGELRIAVPTVPPDVRDAIDTLLRRDPNARPQSAAEALQLIRLARSGISRPALA